MNFFKSIFSFTALLTGFLASLTNIESLYGMYVLPVSSLETGQTYKSGTFALSPTGSYCAIMDSSTCTFYPYNIDAAGTVKALSPASLPLALVLSQLTYSPDGANLFAASATGESAIFSYVNSEGSLIPWLSAKGIQANACSSENCYVAVDKGNIKATQVINGLPQSWNTASFPNAANGTFVQAAFSLWNQCFLAIDSYNNNVWTIGIDNTSYSPFQDTAFSLPVAANPTSIAVSPFPGPQPYGNFAVTSSDGSISFYWINMDYTLHYGPTTNLNLGNLIQSSFSADGTCIAVAYQSAQSGTNLFNSGVNLYSVINTGQLTFQQSLTFSSPVRGTGFTSSGLLVVVTDNKIYTFQLA